MFKFFGYNAHHLKIKDYFNNVEGLVSNFLTECRDALIAIEAAVTLAWEDTNDQLKDFEPRLRKNAFGQHLHSHVLNRIWQLDCAGLVLGREIQPNKNNSYYYVELSLPGFRCTVSSVRTENDLPRPARFREDKTESLQSFFTFENDCLRICPAPALSNIGPSYLQILHGPKDNGDQRYELGFIRVAVYDRLAARWTVTNISAFLNVIPEVAVALDQDINPPPVGVEEIPDLSDHQFGLTDFTRKEYEGEGDEECR